VPDAFDPYHVWLGIAPRDQPPNHYRLLSVDLFEADPEVIGHAADRQMAHLRTFQAGKHGALSQKILNEVAAAKICLLTPQKKAAYDNQLRGRLQPPPPRPPDLPPKLKSSAESGAVVPGLPGVCATAVSSRARPAPPPVNEAGGQQRPQPILAWKAVTLAVVAGLGVVALACWLTIFKRPAAEQNKLPAAAPPSSLILVWPAAQRDRSTLEIDGRAADPDRLARGAVSDELEITNATGPHSLRMRRFGFEPWEWEGQLAAGHSRRVIPKWDERDRGAADWVLSVRGTLQLEFPDRSRRDVTAVPAAPFEITRIGLRDTSSAVSDADLSRLRALLALEDLDLRGSRVAGPGLAHLAALASLKRMDLSNTPVDDAGLASLPRLPALESLALDETAIGDAALNRLSDFPQLRRLSCDKTKVTREGLARLKKALPEIVLSGPVDIAAKAAPPSLQPLAGTVLGNAKAAPPSLLEPLAGTVLGNAQHAGGKAAVWQFQWSAAPGATRYQLQVQSPRPSTPALDDAVIDSTSYQFTQKTIVSDDERHGWKWRVRAIVKDQWTDWSEERSFDVEPPARIASRLAVPAAGVLAPLRDLLEQQWPKDDTQPWRQLAIAAHAIRMARESPDKPAEQYVLLDDAVSRAGRQGDCLLGTLAVQELGSRFETAESERTLAAVKFAAAHARTLLAGGMVMETAFKRAETARSDDDFNAWCEIVRDLETPTSKLLLEQSRNLESQARAVEGQAQKTNLQAQQMKINAQGLRQQGRMAGAAGTQVRQQAGDLTRQANMLANRAPKALEQAQLLRDQARKLKDYASRKSDVARKPAPAARRASDGSLFQVVEARIARIEVLRRLRKDAELAEKRRQAIPADPAANLAVARCECLDRHDWDKGLPLLAKGSAAALSAAAGRVVAQPGQSAARLALADAWWDESEREDQSEPLGALYREAARHWYEEAAPGLSDKDFRNVEKRLISAEAAEAAGFRSGLFSVPLHGLAGLAVMVPRKTDGKISPEGGFATMQGQNASIEYPLIPANAYVGEVDLTPLSPQGSFHMHFGELGHALRLDLAWNADSGKYDCRFVHYYNGVFWECEPRSMDRGRRLTFKLFYMPCHQALAENGEIIFHTGAPPLDLHLHVETANDMAVTIHRCEFRPWTRADSLRQKWPVLQTKIDADWPETALRLYDRNFGLSDNPRTAGEKGFVVPTTGIAMQWVPAGSFERVAGSDAADKAKISISHGFWVSQYETTQLAWLTLMASNPSHTTGSPFLPVDSVGWEDVGRFCSLLNQQEAHAKRVPPNYAYRLPTEFEWEYACRAGAAGDFAVAPSGFWSETNSGWRPHEVGEGAPNAWKLFDMHGNVPEWCLDAWRTEPPLRGADIFVRPERDAEPLVVRGGGWWDVQDGCSSIARERSRSEAGGCRGFRLVLAPILQ
jgi:formylglycine-generating enzyme required for sulfatase activity